MIQLLLSILSKTSTPLIVCQFLLMCNPLRTLIIIITVVFNYTQILNAEVQNPIISADLLGNRSLLQQLKRSWFVICDWWISIHFVCFSVSKLIDCDYNYD